MSLLQTLAQEPAIIASALLKGEVQLPRNYWRTELCCYFFLADSKDELFKILQNNFCPLFWVSNALAATFPIWGPIYYTIGVLFHVAHNVSKWQKKKRSARIQTALNAQAATHTARSVWNPLKPDIPRLRAGKSLLADHLPLYRSVYGLALDADILTLPWQQALDHGLLTLSEAYYLDFLRKNGKAASDRYAALVAEEAAKEEELRKQSAAKALKDAEWDRKKNILFNKLFVKAKTLFSTLILMAALPAAFYVALGVYWFSASIAGPALFAIVRTVTVDIPLFLPTVALIAGIIFTVVTQLSSGSYFTSEIAPKLNKGFDKTATVIGRGLSVLAPVFNLIAAIFVFCIDFIKMFFSKNCPGITYKE